MLHTVRACRDQRITAFVDEDLAQALVARAQREERSVSATAARLLRDALRNDEAGPTQAGFAKDAQAGAHVPAA